MPAKFKNSSSAMPHAAPIDRAPRSQRLRLGFVPLVDCAPLVVAQELGLFDRYEIAVTLSREVGWATVRDKIIYQKLDAAHAPAGMAFSITSGIESIACDCITGLVLNLHGNAITLSQELWDHGVRDARTLGTLIRERRLKKTLTFGVVFPFSSHTALMRQWLRSGGIDPDRDVHLVQVPPPQMFVNLQSGHLDGYCAGEPWNSVAIRSRAGWCPMTSAELDPLHPEKILLVRAEFASEREQEHVALIAALLEACAYCDRAQNHEQIARWLAHRRYLNCQVDDIRRSLGGSFDFGRGDARLVEHFHLFHHFDANEPSRAKALHVLTQLRAGAPSPEISRLTPELAAQVFRDDLYRKALELQRNHQPQSTYETIHSVPQYSFV